MLERDIFASSRCSCSGLLIELDVIRLKYHKIRLVFDESKISSSRSFKRVDIPNVRFVEYSGSLTSWSTFFLNSSENRIVKNIPKCQIYGFFLKTNMLSISNDT